MIHSLRKLRSIGEIEGITAIGSVGAQPKPVEISGAHIHLRMRVSLGAFGPRRESFETWAMPGDIGTLPERIVWKWLEDNRYLYAHELTIGGGREMGGAVLDFLVYNMADRPVAIRVMGDYWHGSAFPGRQAKDDEQSARLRDRGYIVVDLWEGDLLEAVEAGRLMEYIMDQLSGAL